MAARQFEPVVEPDEPSNVTPLPTPAKPRLGEGLATDLLVLALTALSKRFITALADLFTLATAGSAFWLWMSIPDPNPYQIASLTIYAAFILAANWIVRRK